MSVIYEPAGKAKEYCNLALNLYSGCSHGCTYCYVPKIQYKTREQFQEAYPRKDIIRQIAKEAPRYTGQEIHLCFTCDPYQSLEDAFHLTRQTLEIFTAHKIRARILSKGGLRMLKDIGFLKANKAITGATLTFVNEEDSVKFEPGAASQAYRMLALKELKKAGLETWVSLEPIIDPAQTLEIIHLSHGFVDTYKIGRWNHDPESEKINWKKTALDIIEVLKKYNKNYYIKKDLAVFLS